MIDVATPSAASAAPTPPTIGWPRVAPAERWRRSQAVADGVLDVIGRTPTVELSRVGQRTNVRLFGKLEFLNPAGSMKDRPSRKMIEEAIADGRLRSGMTVVESSSGNMGIGLAQACAYHGYRFVCVIDPRTQRTNVQVMQAYGATIDLVEQPDPQTGDFLAARLNRVRQLVADSDDVFWPNQYANVHNPQAHTEGTAAELHAAAGPLNVLLVATSTTGTIGGCLDYFRRVSPQTRVIAVDAANSVLFGGTNGSRAISGLGAGREPELAGDVRPDAIYRVSDLDCVVGCRRLVRAEALLTGGSTGGLIRVFESLEPTLPIGSRVGIIVPDHGSRYLETVYNDKWVLATTGVDSEAVETLVSASTLKRLAPAGGVS